MRLLTHLTADRQPFQAWLLRNVRSAGTAFVWKEPRCDEGSYNRGTPVATNPEQNGRQPASLQSGVVTSPADGMLSRAIAQTLDAPPIGRAVLFARLVRDIEDFMTQHPQERPWTCRLYIGAEGSSIFRGGVGHSLVIDPTGRLWRARSYEDFETTYRLRGNLLRDRHAHSPLRADVRIRGR